MGIENHFQVSPRKFSGIDQSGAFSDPVQEHKRRWRVILLTSVSPEHSQTLSGIFRGMDPEEELFHTEISRNYPDLGTMRQTNLRNRLLTAFKDEPLEDGMTHPAEDIIAEQLKSTEKQPILDWLKGFSLDTEYPCFAASTLRCLGRQEPPPGTTTWRTNLIRDALSIDDLEVQDAAVQAAESWGEREAVEILESHVSSKSWFQKYIQDVISDLRS